MVRAIQAVPFGYVPPNYNKHSGPLLDSCYESMRHKMMKAPNPEGEQKAKFGSCYVPYGWDSCDSLPLMN